MPSSTSNSPHSQKISPEQSSMEGVLQNAKPAGSVRVTPTPNQVVGRPEDNWSFEIKEGHKLQSIKIEYGDNIINTLTFITEFNGVNVAERFGRSTGVPKLSEVTFDSDEELIGIKVSTGIKGRDTYLSSLSFVTNKTTYGPFGRTSDVTLSLPWEKGSLVGFYGTANDWVRGIGGLGVYLKANGEIISIGPWGSPYNPQARWSFQLVGNERLNTITVVYSDAISRLIFNTSEKVDVVDRSGVTIVDQVVLDADEEIIGISGTSELRPTRNTVISSLSFKTNKKVHGPFGNAKGTPFSVAWDVGSFAGFYGFESISFDGIGVYLKATN